MSKILVMAGSPRKEGNTDTLVKAFTEGSLKNNEVDIIRAADLDIHPCIGCNSCASREDGTCFRRDDMDMVIEKMKAADVIVMASPLYFCEISAQLKMVMDRLHAPVRKQLPVKKLALIAVGASKEEDMFEVLKLHYASLISHFHLEDAGMVLVSGVRKKGELSDKDIKAAYELGLSIS